MRDALWPDESGSSHAGEIERFFKGQLRMPLAVLLAVDSSGPVGFVELSIRAFDPSARRKGIGRLLVQAAEEWGRAQGCTEFGSDAVADNLTSQAAHKALGFEEVVQVRCFRKDL